MLDRETSWRQGDLLTSDASLQLGLIESPEDGRFAVVISHDCDIPHPHEPCIEVIVADLIGDARGDPQLSHAKNPRRLHLAYDKADGGSMVLELRHAEKRSIPRVEFGRGASRFLEASLSDESKRTLKQWLAARYGRPAFPNTFENRLAKRVGKRDVKSRIARILAPEARHLVGLFFDLGEQRGIEASDGEPYALSISVAYDAIEGGPDARESAESVVRQLRALFIEAYGPPDAATEIALDACEPVPDTHMTLADLRRVDQWRLEYLSLHDDEHGDFLPDGVAPA